MINNKKLIKTASIITIITLFSKGFGFIRELIIAYYYGTSDIVDIYIMATNIPTILLGFLTCIGTAYTPIYTEISVKKDKRRANGFTNIIAVSIVVISIVLVINVSVFSDKIVKLMAPGFSEKMIQVTKDYLKLSIWNIPVIAVLNVFACYLQCNGRFIQVALCMLTHSSIQIIFTLMAGKKDAVYLVIGYFVANAMYLTVIFFLTIKNKYSLSVVYCEKTYIISLGKLVVPIFLSSMLTQINGYIDKYFASSLEEGAISALNYANTIKTFIVMMINTGLTTVLYPTLSRYIIQNNITKVKDMVWSSVRYCILVFTPVTVGIIIIANQMIKIMFERGNFNQNSVEMTSMALVMYTVGIFAIGIRDIMTNFFYSVKNSKFTLFISTIVILINILFNIIMVRFLGFAGLALGTSLSAVISLPLYFTKLKKYIGKKEKNDFDIVFVIKVVTASFIMGIIVFSTKYIPIKVPVLKLFFQIGIGFFGYFGICYLMKIKETIALLQIMINLIKGKKHE